MKPITLNEAIDKVLDPTIKALTQDKFEDMVEPVEQDEEEFWALREREEEAERADHQYQDYINNYGGQNDSN